MKQIKYDLKSVKKVKELRKKGLSFREIMRAMNKKDIKTIYRWYTYELPAKKGSVGSCG